MVEIRDLFDFDDSHKLLIGPHTGRSQAHRFTNEGATAGSLSQDTDMSIIECKELKGKTIERCTIYDDGASGSEVRLQFEDGTEFSATLRISTKIEAQHTQDEGGEPTVLKDYTPS